ncbi:family 43 glycosylhydrolase [Flammeovirga agarivorans]|uniref:Family 43 glycosylhydrolase n=1 Tax=Flammeovirga agarivorans TaxID=2726742 RepID=A0A7X8XXQ2_9BACT|nr:family 43 glycosylhydrolase [Flammeovirga agarivorans]NLR93363.1 family 43 glycosylhydrolase [Flammeovirga agarivorans]
MMKLNCKNLLFFLGWVWSIAGYSQNPLITHRFSADPTARVMNDTLFVFPSSDTTCTQIKGNNGFCMPDYHVYSTTDLTTWKDHGEILSHNTVPWVEENSYGMWAPDCIEKDGKYYFYFPAMPKDGSAFRRIGVAVADTPTGPYTPENSYIEGIEGIDPNVFIDDDGSIFLYFGGGENLFYVELNQDMKTIKTKPQKVEGLPSKYKEGPFVFKRKDKYYFTFPHAPGPAEEISYAVGDSPRGPFEYKGKVLEHWKDGCWTNHHSFVEYKGEWLLFYHHMDISGNKHRRSMCADRIYFDEDGNIPEIKATQRGIAALTANNAIQLDRYSVLENATVTKTNAATPNWIVKRISEKTQLEINEINFENNKWDHLALFVSSQEKATIEVLANNKKLSAVEVPKMKEGEWRLVKAPLLFSPEGMVDLSFQFSGNTEFLALDWMQCLTRKQVLLSKSYDIDLFNAANQKILFQANQGNIYSEKEFRQLKPHILSTSLVQGEMHINSENAVHLDGVKKGDVVSFSSDKSRKMYDAFVGIEAANYSDQEGVMVESCKLGGKNVGYIENGDYLMFNNLLFPHSPKKVTIGIASPNKGGIVEIRKEKVDGELVASFNIDQTGGWQNWSSITSDITAHLVEDEKIYVVFKGDKGFLMNIKDVRFE